MIVYFFISPLAIVLVVSLPLLILLSTDILMIEPLAWLLERQSLDKLIKAGSILLLLIGFHFDLLAS